MFLNEAAFDPKKAREHGCSAMLLFRCKNGKPFSVHCSKYLVKFVQLVVRNPRPFVMDEVVEAAFSLPTAVHGRGDPIERQGCQYTAKRTIFTEQFDFYSGLAQVMVVIQLCGCLFV
jgi:hypothetical protein